MTNVLYEMGDKVVLIKTQYNGIPLSEKDKEAEIIKVHRERGYPHSDFHVTYKIRMEESCFSWWVGSADIVLSKKNKGKQLLFSFMLK